jgi:hypothetical protein
MFAAWQQRGIPLDSKRGKGSFGTAPRPCVLRLHAAACIDGVRARADSVLQVTWFAGDPEASAEIAVPKKP